MATTTYEALRDAQITAIQAIAPSLLVGTKFKVNRGELDFRDWADANPQGALRRFAVADLFEDEPVEASNLDVEPRIGRGEIVVAYPRNHRYGRDNKRDLADVLRADRIDLINAAGHRGHASFTDATVFETTSRVELGEVNTFLVLDYRYSFWSDVS